MLPGAGENQLLCRAHDARAARRADQDTEAGLYICEQFRQRWGIKMADPRFMLGVSRKKWIDENGVTHLEMTQQKSVDELYEEYRDQLPKISRKTPFLIRFFCLHAIQMGLDVKLILMRLRVTLNEAT